MQIEKGSPATGRPQKLSKSQWLLYHERMGSAQGKCISEQTYLDANCGQ